MVIKRIPVEDYHKSGRISAIAFVSPYDQEKERAKEIDQSWLSCAVGAYDEDGELTASMSVIPYNVRFDGQDVKMAGIGGVASLPETRQRGNVRALFEFAYDEMLKDGVLFSALFPFSHDYYRKFGYELCMIYPTIEMPLTLLRDFPQPHGVNMIDAGAIQDEFEGVRRRFIANKNMAITRNDEGWKSELGGGLKNRSYAYLMKDEDGIPEAYIILRAEDGKERFEKNLNISDIAYLSYPALRRVLGFLYRLRAQYDKVTLIMPSTEEILPALPEAWEYKATISTYAMARAVDVEGILKVMALPCGSGSFAIQVSDDMIDRNNGVFSVSYNEDGRTITKGSGAPDARMDIRTFSLLSLGASALEQAKVRDSLEILGNEETLKKVFVKKTVFMTDHF